MSYSILQFNTFLYYNNNWSHDLNGCGLTIFLVFHSYDDLWCSIVPGHHVRGHHECLVSCSSKTKIQDLKELKKQQQTKTIKNKQTNKQTKENKKDKLSTRERRVRPLPPPRGVVYIYLTENTPPTITI